MAGGKFMHEQRVIEDGITVDFRGAETFSTHSLPTESTAPTTKPAVPEWNGEPCPATGSSARRGVE